MKGLTKNLAETFTGAVKTLLPESLILRLFVQKELRNGDPELKILHCLCSRSEAALDVGASRGTYSYLLSRYTNRVIAIEPHPTMAKRLRKSLPKSVEVLSFAASDQEGECEFHIPMLGGEELNARCSLEADVNKEFATRTIAVERRRLDNLPMADCGIGVVKIDVEGHEFSTLQGLTGVVERSKPTVIVESEARHHAGAPRNVFDFFSSHGYRGFFVHGGVLHPIEEFSVDRFQSDGSSKPIDGKKSSDYVNNFIFIHSSRGEVLERVKQVFPAAESRRRAAALN